MTTSALVSAAFGLDGSVRLGGHAIATSHVREALELCDEHEPGRSLSACIDAFWVPRWLLDEEAQAQKLADQPQMRKEVADILHRHLVRRLSTGSSEISDRDVDAYLEKHQRDFSKPLRLRLFRILLSTEEEAKKLLSSLTKDTSIEDFRKLARKKSLDQATHERGGDLGFVWPDGSTDVPQVRVNTSLYEAALPLVDGQFAPEVVPEGERFAILWRRGSKAASAVSEESRKLARLRLLEEDRERQVQRLLSDLKKAHERGRNDVLLGKLRRKEATLFQER